MILESSDDLRITENVITHSVATACDGCGIAVQIYGNRNLVAGNTLIDSPRYGIEVDDFQDPGHSPATGNVLRDNRVVVAGIGILCTKELRSKAGCGRKEQQEKQRFLESARAHGSPQVTVPLGKYGEDFVRW